VIELANAYDPDVVAVQLNVVGSHDAPRLRTVLGGDARRALLAMLLQATLPGAPSIFYGDEVGLAGGQDPDCRGAFPWDEARWEPGLRDSVRALLLLRRAETGLRDGPLRVAGAAGPAVAFERGEGVSHFIVAVNPGDTATRLDIRLHDPRGGARLEAVDLPGLGGITAGAIQDGRATLELPAHSGSILRIH
jgi:glycosidase